MLNNKLRWVIPTIALAIQMFYIPSMQFYNVQSGVHWLLYIIVFSYLLSTPYVKELFFKLIYGLRNSKFCMQVLIYVLAAFTVLMTILVLNSEPFPPMYRLWQPHSVAGLLIWPPLYVFVQPLSDNIIYHKWIVGTKSNVNARFMLLGVAIVRTFAETGVLIVNKYSTINGQPFISIALWTINVIFAICYFGKRDEFRSYPWFH